MVLDTLPYNLENASRRVLNNRLVFESGTGASDDLISYGTEPGPPIIIGTIPSFADFVSRGAGYLLYRFPGENSAPDTLMISRGEANDFTSTLLFSGSSSDRVVTFSIDQDLFVYGLTDETGESIFSLDTETLNTQLVTDLYEDSAGSGLSDFNVVNGRLLVKNNSSQYFLLTSDLLGKDSVSVIGSNLASPDPENYIGSIGNRYYYMSYTDSGPILELDTDAKTLRELSDQLVEDWPVTRSNLVQVGDKFYNVDFSYLIDPQRAVINLYEIDPVTEGRVVVVTDTISGNTVRPGGSVSTDGRYVYFPKLQVDADAVGPAIYDPQTEDVMPVGPTQESTSYFFQLLGSQMYVHYAAFNLPVESFPVSPAGLGDTLELDIASRQLESYNLGSSIISLRGNTLLSTNKTSGVVSELTSSGTNDILALTPIDEQTAIFFRANEGSNVYALWRTDGTSPGTRKVLDFPDADITFPKAISVLSNHVGIIVGSDNQVYLYDPLTDLLQFVDLEIGNRDELVSISNNLFTYAYDRVFGSEIHQIKVVDQELISGVVFHDENQNGTHDANEPGIPNAGIEVEGGNVRTVYTAPDGTFSLPVRDGEGYEIAVTAPNCYQELTTPASYQIQYSSSESYLFPFGYGTSGGEAELRTVLNSGTIRCGFEHDFWLTVLNDGCQPLAGETTVTFPEDMTYLEADENPLTNEDNSLTFAFDTLQPGASHRLRIRFRLPDENFAGQDILLGAAAGARNVEGAMIQSDTFAYREILRCAIDPNDKQVSPSRPEPSNSNYTQFDETLRYTIRFQNTGNDTAFTVRIQDQISESLDLATLKPLAASHPYTVSVRTDRTLVFLFENVLLPDSTTNLPGSQGFVTFEINTHPDLDNFSTLDNTAGIYFDFNQPVITNTVTSTLVEFLDEDQDGFLFYEECDDEVFAINPAAEEIPNNGVDENCDDLDDFPVSVSGQLPGSFEYFPNPTGGLLQLRYSAGEPLFGELYAANGARLRSFRFQNSHSLNLQSLPAGLYLLRVYSEESRGVVVRVVRD